MRRRHGGQRGRQRLGQLAAQRALARRQALILRGAAGPAVAVRPARARSAPAASAGLERTERARAPLWQVLRRRSRSVPLPARPPAAPGRSPRTATGPARRAGARAMGRAAFQGRAALQRRPPRRFEEARSAAGDARRAAGRNGGRRDAPQECRPARGWPRRSLPPPRSASARALRRPRGSGSRPPGAARDHSPRSPAARGRGLGLAACRRGAGPRATQPCRARRGPCAPTAAPRQSAQFAQHLLSQVVCEALPV